MRRMWSRAHRPPANAGTGGMRPHPCSWAEPGTPGRKAKHAGARPEVLRPEAEPHGPLPNPTPSGLVLRAWPLRTRPEGRAPRCRTPRPFPSGYGHQGKARNPGPRTRDAGQARRPDRQRTGAVGAAAEARASGRRLCGSTAPADSLGKARFSPVLLSHVHGSRAVPRPSEDGPVPFRDMCKAGVFGGPRGDRRERPVPPRSYGDERRICT